MDDDEVPPVRDPPGSCYGGPPGIDCSDYGGDAHWQRRVEAREWRRDQDDGNDEAPAEAGA